MTLTEIERLWDSVEQPTDEDRDMWYDLCRNIRVSADRYIRNWFKQEESGRQSFSEVSLEMVVIYDEARKIAYNAFIANCLGLARLNQIDDHWLRWGRSWLDDGREQFFDHAVKIVAQTIREGEEKNYASGNQSLAG